MRKLMLLVVLVVVALGGCVDERTETTDATTQDVVGGVFTITLSPLTFQPNQVAVLDTGAIAVIDGSAWLSASVSLHCTSTTTITGKTTPWIEACAREYDPAAPSMSTTWCAPIVSCSGDNTYSLPMTAFTADAHHALAITVKPSTTAVSIINAVLTEFTVGD